MSPDQLFSLCNLLVLPGWALLLVLPGWKWTVQLIASIIIPVLLGGIYAYLIFIHIGDTQGGFSALSEVALLFENPYLLLAGWIHYLAFDLFVGCWEVRDAQRLGIPHWYVAPCLIFTFLFGPIGMILYVFMRLIIKGRVLIGTEGNHDHTE